jgi:hypothetical protein
MKIFCTRIFAQLFCGVEGKELPRARSPGSSNNVTNLDLTETVFIDARYAMTHSLTAALE